MKNTSFALLALSSALCATGFAGCRSRSAQQSDDALPLVTQAPAPTATPKPEFPEDERYSINNASEKPFAPDAPPELIATYKTAMAKVRQDRPPLAMKVPDKARVVLTTNRGPITLELDGKAAPLHVKSFVYLAGKGFYDGTMFHRHDALMGGGKGFIVQGGDPLTKDAMAIGLAGAGGPGYSLPREKNKLTHKKLVVVAAREIGDPDSAGSQFYITQDAAPFLDEGDGYTVFGKVVAGREAALKLTKGDTLQSVKIEQGNTNLKSAQTDASAQAPANAAANAPAPTSAPPS